MKKHETINFEQAMHKCTAYMWLGLGIVALCAAFFCGAWWHLLTAAICAVFYTMFKSEEEENEEER